MRPHDALSIDTKVTCDFDFDRLLKIAILDFVAAGGIMFNNTYIFLTFFLKLW